MLISFLNTYSGFKIYLHRYFKLHAPDQGFPLTYIYSDMGGGRRGALLGDQKRRFDWLKVFQDTTLQVCALIEMESPDGRTLLFLGVDCEKTKKARNEQHPVFPVVKYKTAR